MSGSTYFLLSLHAGHPPSKETFLMRKYNSACGGILVPKTAAGHGTFSGRMDTLRLSEQTIKKGRSIQRTLGI